MSLHGKIATELRQQITAGELKPDDFLPTEAQLAERYDVSRTTIKAATATLVNAGLVERVVGARGGMRVRRKMVLSHYLPRAESPDSPPAETDTFQREVREQGFEPSQEFRLHIVELTAEIAQRLEVEEGSAAVLRRCVRAVNGDPNSIQATYYPEWLTRLVPDLLSPRDIPIGTTQLLANRGYKQLAFKDVIAARMPTPEETTDLRLPASGTPILEQIRTGCTRERAVRVTVHSWVGDTNRLVTTHGDAAALRRALEFLA